MSPCSLLMAIMACGALAGAEDAIPLHLDAPASVDDHPLLIGGGIPFAVGTLATTDRIRIHDGHGHDIPCQARALATWPDGSVKWALVECVQPPSAVQGWQLVQDAGGRPQPHDALAARLVGGQVAVTGGTTTATIGAADDGALRVQIAIGGHDLVAPHAGAWPRLTVARASDDTGARALAPGSAILRDPGLASTLARAMVDQVAIEDPGPLHAVVLVRGRFLVKGLGAGLPPQATKDDPAGQLPFSLRIGLVAGTGEVIVEHQLIFTGEPDRDFITGWSLPLPGQGGPRSRLCIEPGAVLDGATTGTLAPSDGRERLCWAPLAHGLALIRDGWQNRPTGIIARGPDAEIELWPCEAGAWDLRRYAREWSVGETGNTRDPGDMARYATLAARGMAKSHVAVIDALAAGDLPARAALLNGPALLLAGSEQYARSGALGGWCVATSSPRDAALEAMARRRIDYHLFCQDLFGWCGQLTYGFWQSRYGQVHRTDRWDCDYGRWGWSLGDGGGRVGHMLLQEFLRVGDRRYFDAGAAYARICYDTNLVHVHGHFENAKGWWTTLGCSHRHNVQPFGDPYIGMRGSYPEAARILYFLTGDGAIHDGLDLVADCASAYMHGQRSRLCDSGGTDGDGSAACALLFRAEERGQRADLDDCRALLLASKALPPAKPEDIGYGAGFGLYVAAAEYAALTHDADIGQRLVETARVCARAKDALPYLQAIAAGAALGRDSTLVASINAMLDQLAAHASDGLDGQPRATWPGHCGWSVPEMDPNALRDLPWAFAVDGAPVGSPARAAHDPDSAMPASAPAGWFHPGGEQRAEEHPADPGQLVGGDAKAKAEVIVGACRWEMDANGLGAARLGDADILTGPAAIWVDYRDAADAEKSPPRVEHVVLKGQRTSNEDKSAFRMALAAGATTVEMADRISQVGGTPMLRLDACLHGDGRPIAAWGMTLGLAIGGDAHAREVTTPCRFRLERCRMDQNDERIPNWLTAEYKWGEGAPLWPLWRQAGIELLPGGSYRTWRASGADTAPVVCDSGIGGAPWLDFTDRSATPSWGLTARVLRGPLDHAAIRVDLEHGTITVEFISDALDLPDPAPSKPRLGCIEFALHDGYRPPLSPPELTPGQYQAFIKDLDYDENPGLAALRFVRSITHKVQGIHWLEEIRDLGVEPREILYQMRWGDGLRHHCERLGIPYDAGDIEATVQRVIARYLAH